MPRKGDSRLAPVKNEVIAFYEAGHSLSECGEQFGVKPGVARDLLLACGVTLRSPKAGQEAKRAREPWVTGFKSSLIPDREEIIEMYANGHTLNEIGDKFGRSFVSVLTFLRRNGVAIRTRSESTKLGWNGTKKDKRLVADAGPYLAAELRATAAATKQSAFDFTLDEPTRRCPRCEKDVPRSRWWKMTGKAMSSYCKSCMREYVKGRPKYVPGEEARRKSAVKRAEYRRRIKQAVLVAYGSKCACCGDGHQEFLSIDHIHGDGNKHREYLKSKGVYSSSFYLWLKRNNYPSEFRLLCTNCNQSRGCYGYCPHDGGKSFLDVDSPAKLKWRKKRLTIIEGYGGKCACCGESTPEFLAIDHVDGGGSTHRRERKKLGLSNTSFYQQVIDEGFPSVYRILCNSCNWARGVHGYCPHTHET